MYKIVLKATRKNKDSPFWFFSPAGQAYSSIVETAVQQNQHLIESTRRGYVDESELQYNVVYVTANKSNWELFQSSLVATAPGILEERDQYFIDNKHALTVIIVPAEGQDPMSVVRVSAEE